MHFQQKKTEKIQDGRLQRSTNMGHEGKTNTYKCTEITTRCQSKQPCKEQERHDRPKQGPLDHKPRRKQNELTEQGTQSA